MNAETVTRQELLELELLECALFRAGPEGRPVAVSTLEQVAGDRDLMLETCRRLVGEGDLRRDNRTSGGYHLTAAGRERAQEFVTERDNPRSRRASALRELMHWLDAKDATGAGGRALTREFDGRHLGSEFTESETQAAADRLVENGLAKSLRGSDQHIALWLTHRGQDFADSGLSLHEFLKPPPTGSNFTTNVSVQNSTGVHVANAAGTNAQASADGDSQNRVVLDLAHAIRQAWPVLNLPQYAESVLDELEQDEDPSRRKRAAQVMGNLLQDTTSGALGSVLGQALIALAPALATLM